MVHVFVSFTFAAFDHREGPSLVSEKDTCPEEQHENQAEVTDFFYTYRALLLLAGPSQVHLKYLSQDERVTGSLTGNGRKL